MSYPYEDLGFREFQSRNAARSKLWMNNSGSEIEHLLFHSNELGDECGEVQGTIKKLVRGKWGIPGAISEADAMANAADEIADVITVAFLIADHLGIDVESALKSKFNRVSDKHGFKVKI